MSDILINWDAWFMKHVYLAASKSKDPSSKIGAVLVRDRRIISTGYNGFPVGVNDLKERYEDRETKYKMVCHAEFNSIITCAKFGIDTKDTIMYTQGVPCSECAKSVIQGGIKEVIVHKQWRDVVREGNKKWEESAKISKTMFDEAGVAVREIDVTLDMVGYKDYKTINV